MKKTIFILFSSLLVIAGCTDTTSVNKAEHQGPRANTSKDIVDDATIIESLLKQEEKAFNKRDFKKWQLLYHPETRTYDNTLMKEIEENKVTKKVVFVETLYTNGEQAIVRVKSNFRQELEFDDENNWNLNTDILLVFVKYEGEWKLFTGSILREAWLLEDGTEDPEATFEYDIPAQLELVEKIKKESLKPLDTIMMYHWKVFQESYEPE